MPVPSARVTLLTLQPGLVQSATASSLAAKAVPNMLTNPISAAVRLSIRVPSWSFHASQTARSAAIRASVTASGAGDLASAGFDGPTAFGAAFFGSTIRFSPWKATFQLSPGARTQTVAARTGLGRFIILPPGPKLQGPSKVAL